VLNLSTISCPEVVKAGLDASTSATREMCALFLVLSSNLYITTPF